MEKSPMKIGLLSDTHGATRATARAIQLLMDMGVETLIHCGDIGSEAVLIEIAAALHGHSVPVFAALGNVDEYDLSILHFPQSSGIRIAHTHRLLLDGKSCMVIHGHDTKAMGHAISDPTLDFVFTGHTHQRSDLPGPPRILNPGAVHRCLEPSVALLDTRNEVCHWLDI